MEGKNVYEKLAAVQLALKVPKSQYNSFGKYSYRSCEDIVEEAKPHLAKEGLLLTMSDELVQMGARYYVKATATVISLADASSYSVTAYAREDETNKGMNGSQITGSASSYARKYALNGLFAIDDTKDSDTDENRRESEARQNYNQKQHGTLCADCGRVIADAKKKDGSQWAAADIIAFSTKKYNVALCKSCMGKRYKAQQNN